jgi:betaine-aldehyde dehydrogenase
MVFKPSELTPVTAIEPGENRRGGRRTLRALNVVLGKGDIGAALATHPGIAKISLTGSVPTGKRVMAQRPTRLST